MAMGGCRLVLLASLVLGSKGGRIKGWSYSNVLASTVNLGPYTKSHHYSPNVVYEPSNLLRII